MIQVQFEQMPGYLAARFIGEGIAEEVWRQFESIAERCKRTNNNKLLVDFTAGRPISLAERYFIGESGRVFASYKLKVACVARAEHLDPDLFGLLVAQNRGVNVRAFTDAQSAEEWLLK